MLRRFGRLRKLGQDIRTSLRAGMRMIAWLDQHSLQTLILILLLALAVNLAWIWHAPPTSRSGDTEQWWPLVLSVAHGRGYVLCSSNYFPFCGPANQVTAEKEPVPVLIFAGAALLSHDSLMAATLVQLTAHLGILLAIFFLARKLGGTRPALLAALLWSVYLPAIELVPQVSSELLTALGITWGLFFLIRASMTDHTRDWLAAGVCLGLGALSRSIILGVGLALAIGLILRLRFRGSCSGSTKRRFPVVNLKPVGLFAVAFALVNMPWMIRNYAAFGRPVIGSTLAGYNLYRHNQVLLTDNYLRYAGPGDAKKAISALVARRVDLRGTENEAQMNVVYREEAVHIIASEPFRYGLLSAYRFFALWFDWKIPEAYGLPIRRSYYLIVAYQCLLLALAAIGLPKTWPRSWPVAVSVAVVTLLYMATVGRLRHITVVMSLVIALGAVGATHLLVSLKSKR